MNPTTTTLTELPPNCTPGLDIGGITTTISPNLTHYYRCHTCTTWIQGQPHPQTEDTRGQPHGRHGTAYHCHRCGHEIGFYHNPP
jgi:predicted SprT family Zn-dependent metalloprotease